MDKGRPTLEMSPAVFEQRAARVKPEDVATIIYTSGTTGEPKGAMLTHSNFVSNVTASCEVIPITGDAVALSFLPLSHVFERMLDYAYLYRGSSIAYAESIDKLARQLRRGQPARLRRGPARLREGPRAHHGEGRGGQRPEEEALPLGRSASAASGSPTRSGGEPLPGGLARKAKIADKLVFSKIRHALGNRFRYAVSGGAPLARDLAEFFVGAGVMIYEGYGLTETSPVIAVNGPNAWRLGTVGKPLSNVEVKIAADGEILTRGPHVMKGYFNKPEATAEAIDADGWFHTGDIGQLDEDGFLVITDRKKDLIVLAGGKNVAPQPIENELKKLALHRGSDRPRRPAQVHRGRHRPELRQAARVRRVVELVASTGRSLDSDPVIRALYQQEIDAYNAGKPHHEQIHAFAILSSDLTIEDGSITPTLKVKRRILESRYQDLIDSMYRAAEKAHVA